MSHPTNPIEPSTGGMTDRPCTEIAILERDALKAENARLLAACDKWQSNEEAILDRLNKCQAELEAAKETAHYANGVADLAMKHRDVAEADAAALREALDSIHKRQPADGIGFAMLCGRYEKIAQQASESTTAGESLLKRLREAEWIVANVHGMRDDKTREWFERAEEFKKGIK